MIRIAGIFYGLMGAIALGLGYLLDLDLFGGTSIVWSRDIGIGLGIGLSTVGLSRWLDKTFEWARNLSEGFRSLLGEGGIKEAFILASLSGFAEELLFRGLLQQWLDLKLGPWAALVITSLVFGAVHIGPNWKQFWPWTVMAVVMGGVLGLAWIFTGNLVGVIVAHFTINFINLTLIFRRAT